MSERLTPERIAHLLELEAEVSRLRQALEQSNHIRNSWQLALRQLKATRGRLEEATEHLESEVAARTEALEASNRDLRRLSLAIAQTASAVLITDAAGRIEYVNAGFTTNTGYSAEEAIGRTPSLIASGRTPSDVYEDLWSTIGAGHAWHGEMLNRNKDGELRWTYLTISPIVGDDGAIQAYVAVSDDVTELKRAYDRMAEMGLYDPLTGLPNRRLFEERVEQACREAKRNRHKIGLMFLDLDRFKRINDTHGHAVGDTVLAEIARRLKSQLRESDTVGRLGGDEFIVLLPRLEAERGVHRVARKLLGTLREPIQVGQSILHISGSIGITVGPDDGQTVETLLKHADFAMYRAKEQGRDTAQLYSAELDAELAERARLERDLADAARRGELSLALQPIFDVRGEAPVAAEALLRWNHPELGAVPPSKFIEIAEDSGLITSLGAWVLDHACRHGRRILDAHPGGLPVAVNVSPRQLQAPDFALHVEHALARHGLPGRLLHIELTESLLMEDTELSTRCLRDLAALGVTISIDDFGTGYSSLAYIKRLPIDVVKIDKTFVQGTPGDRTNTAICSAVIAMAHALDLSVIAEGVERHEELEFLQEAGCDCIQGFLLARPEPIERLLERLDARREALLDTA